MTSKSQKFSLLGGPLHELGVRAGLVNNETNSVKLGIALGLLTWGVMIILSLIDGTSVQVFSLSFVGAHVRLLIVIPMFFVCESLVAPRMTSFINITIKTDLIAPSSEADLNANIAQINKWKDAWLPELVFILIAVMLTLSTQNLQFYGTTAASAADKFTKLAISHQWYLIFCLTLFRFLMLRWLWHLGIWCFILWRTSKLELNLIPTHPDGVAGLSGLETVHIHFIPLVFALSALQAAMLTEEISTNRMDFAAIYLPIMLVLIIDAVLFLGPLFIFSPKLWACKVQRSIGYMALSSKYIKDFDNKWLKNKESTQDVLLGTADLQSLADLQNSISVMRNMRWLPISASLLVTLLTAALVPMLPLLLLKYPMTELAQRFFTYLLGF